MVEACISCGFQAVSNIFHQFYHFFLGFSLKNKETHLIRPRSGRRERSRAERGEAATAAQHLGGRPSVALPVDGEDVG